MHASSVDPVYWQRTSNQLSKRGFLSFLSGAQLAQVYPSWRSQEVPEYLTSACTCHGMALPRHPYTCTRLKIARGTHDKGRTCRTSRLLETLPFLGNIPWLACDPKADARHANIDNSTTTDAARRLRPAPRESPLASIDIGVRIGIAFRKRSMAI